MTFLRLTLRDISRNEFRSWAVFLCAALVAGLVLATGLVTGGVAESLFRTERRLGADLLVVPNGTETDVQSALLMGGRTSGWLSDDVVDRVRALPGVAGASPQKYLMSLSGASCCSASDMFVVAFDPASDFTVRPWLEEDLEDGLALGQAVGGRFVSEPEDGLRLYGYPLELARTLDPTGSNLDQSLFITFETAEEIERVSLTEAEQPLVIPPDSVSSILVKVAEGADAGAVGVSIRREIADVSVVTRPEMFGDFKRQSDTVRRVLSLLVSITAVLALGLTAVVFAMATHERRRELGVWRALGATRGHVAGTLVAQAAILALGGGVTGALIAAYGIFLFHDYIVTQLGVPFLFPDAASLLPRIGAGLLAATGTAIAAAVWPALEASRSDPAEAMRE